MGGCWLVFCNVRYKKKYIYDIQVPSVRLLRWITDEWLCMYARNGCSSLLLALRPASRDAGAIKVAAQACFGVAGAQGFAQHTQTRSTKPRIILSQSSELTVRRCTITPILCHKISTWQSCSAVAECCWQCTRAQALLQTLRQKHKLFRMFGRPCLAASPKMDSGIGPQKKIKKTARAVPVHICLSRK